MRWMAIIAVALVGCGTVDSTNDGTTQTMDATGSECPTEDYTVTGSASFNPNCMSGDLYTVSHVSENPVSCTAPAGACTQTVNAICSKQRVVATGGSAAQGLCSFTVTRYMVDEAGDCMQTCTFTGVADLAQLQQYQAMGGYPTH